MCQNKERIPAIWCSDKIAVRKSDQPEMILTDAVLEESPDVYVTAIHNGNHNGTAYDMNFELSNGYVTKQTEWSTNYRHVIPGAVFTHTTQVLVHYQPGECIDGFRFLDAKGNELWRHGYIGVNVSVRTVNIPNTHRFVGFRATPYENNSVLWNNM